VHHVALVGYGTFLVPRTPFELGSTSAELDDVVIVHRAAAAPQKARIVPGPEGCRLQLGPGTRTIDDVVEVLDEVSVRESWLLELGPGAGEGVTAAATTMRDDAGWLVADWAPDPCMWEGVHPATRVLYAPGTTAATWLTGGARADALLVYVR